MAKYNTKREVKNKATTHEGGQGYKYSPEQELIGILATGVNNTYYESMKTREDRLTKVIGEVVKSRGAEFVAKALVYARAKMGQRSVTHAGAVALAPYLAGTEIGKYVFSKYDRKREVGGVVYRLDDMLEMVAYYMALNEGKRLPNAMTKGFRSAVERADKYELAKYQASNRSVSMVDLFNLVHPKPKNNDQTETFKQLMSGELKQFNTAEDRNTKAGQDVANKVKAGDITKDEAEAELKEAKTQNFKELLQTKKLGYKALLMNLRNILNLNDTDTVNLAVDVLTNKDAIKRSLIQPLEIDVAAEVLTMESVGTGQHRTKVLKALDTAYQLAIPNIAEVFGDEPMAVVFDTSGSMTWASIKLNGKVINRTPSEKAALMAATFVKGVGADVYHFATECKAIQYNPNDTFNSIKKVFKSQEGKVGHGTNFSTIVNKLKGLDTRYKRVIVISDMQGHDCFDWNVLPGNPYIYAINVVGYGTTMANPKNPRVFSLFGYSAEMVRLVTQMEIDAKALIKEIEAVRLY